jgi:microcystin-dependent protein
MANLKIGSDSALDKNGFIQNYPVGMVIIKNSSTVDDGWLLCDGRYVNTADYPELDAVVGTAYGARVGGTFRLPPLVFNATNNPQQRIPFSTISSESGYPNSFNHNHSVGITGTSFDGYNHDHNHNTNTATSRSGVMSHNHGTISGNTVLSNAASGFSPTRAAGPAGPYASGANSAATSHDHAGGAWSSNTQNSAVNHTHNVQIHNQTNHNHTHDTNMGSLSHSVSTSTISPLSRQVYFLIKT